MGADVPVQVTDQVLPPRAGQSQPIAWSLPYRQGYDEGYRAAVRDLLGSLLKLSDEYIGHHSVPSSEVRKVVYAFEEYLERRIVKMSPDDEFFVQDGLGI